LKITLPYPPSVNKYWRHVVMGKRSATLLSREARDFKAVVALICEVDGMRPFNGLVRVEVDAYRPRKIGDLDGVLKGCLDSLKGYAFVDDNQVVEIVARRFDDKYRPRLEVTVCPFKPTI
jgi:crossover junction endodeoxyribonuclease RusA